MQRFPFSSLTGLGALVVAAALLIVPVPTPAASAAHSVKLDKFAKCLSEKKAIMYGAFWCSHCQEQKELFGQSFRYVPYVECAVPGNPRQQAPACSEVGIRSYPTWTFPDGERRKGVQPLAELGKKTGCNLE